MLTITDFQQQSFGRYYPVRIKILMYEFYVVQGAENIKVLFKSLGRAHPFGLLNLL